MYLKKLFYLLTIMMVLLSWSCSPGEDEVSEPVQDKPKVEISKIGRASCRERVSVRV